MSKPKYEYLIKKYKDAGIKHVNNSNTFIEFSNTMDGVYENINNYNPNRRRKILIVFDDMIADIMMSKKFQAVIKKLFIRCRKLNISLVFITQSYFPVPKIIKMTVTDQSKILDRKIMQNEAQYDLDRKAAKISPLSSTNLDKYEYLTGEDLGLKLSAIEQAKLEYSPLGRVFTRGLKKEEEDKKGLFKRQKNIENKIKGGNKKELGPIKNEKKSEVLKDESSVAHKKPKEIVLLKDKLDFIFKNFGSNFNNTGKKVLIKHAKDEKRLIIIIFFF